jgi:hypothetical protein
MQKSDIARGLVQADREALADALFDFCNERFGTSELIALLLLRGISAASDPSARQYGSERCVRLLPRTCPHLRRALATAPLVSGFEQIWVQKNGKMPALWSRMVY